MIRVIRSMPAHDGCPASKTARRLENRSDIDRPNWIGPDIFCVKPRFIQKFLIRSVPQKPRPIEPYFRLPTVQSKLIVGRFHD